MSEAWNLPPGCTPADIERNAGDDELCAVDGCDELGELLEDGDAGRYVRSELCEKHANWLFNDQVGRFENPEGEDE